MSTWRQHARNYEPLGAYFESTLCGIDVPDVGELRLLESIARRDLGTHPFIEIAIASAARKSKKQRKYAKAEFHKG